MLKQLYRWGKGKGQEETLRGVTSNSLAATLKCSDAEASHESMLFTTLPEGGARTAQGQTCQNRTPISVWTYRRDSPSKPTFPRWRMDANNLNISQHSLSEKVRTLRAVRMSPKSSSSSRPSHVVQLPWEDRAENLLRNNSKTFNLNKVYSVEAA